MSKLQKKKTVTDKKRRKEDGVTEDSAAVETPAVKPAAPVQAARPKPSVGEPSPAASNVFTRAADFLREVKVELKKVTWPTRKQTTGTTIVVILFVFVVAAFLGLFDLGLSKLVQVVLT